MPVCRPRSAREQGTDRAKRVQQTALIQPAQQIGSYQRVPRHLNVSISPKMGTAACERICTPPLQLADVGMLAFALNAISQKIQR